MKGSTQLHQNLVKDFMITACSEFPDIMILTYTNGMFRAYDNPERIIRAGLKGVLDLLVMGKGFYIWFDAKTGRAVFTKEQKAFRERLFQINEKQVAFKLPDVKTGLAVIREFRGKTN